MSIKNKNENEDEYKAEKQITEITILGKTHSCLKSFIIFGSPARKSNSRIFTGTSLTLGKGAQEYLKLFNRQIKRIDFSGIDCNDKSLLWLFVIYYNNKSADASIELLFDFMQKNDVIKNDNTIRKYIVYAEELDYESPRTEVYIFKETV